MSLYWFYFILLWFQNIISLLSLHVTFFFPSPHLVVDVAIVIIFSLFFACCRYRVTIALSVLPVFQLYLVPRPLLLFPHHRAGKKKKTVRPSVNERFIDVHMTTTKKHIIFLYVFFDYYYYFFYILFPYLCVTGKVIYLVFFPSSSCFVITCFDNFFVSFFLFLSVAWYLSIVKSSIDELYNKEKLRQWLGRRDSIYLSNPCHRQRRHRESIPFHPSISSVYFLAFRYDVSFVVSFPLYPIWDDLNYSNIDIVVGKS